MATAPERVDAVLVRRLHERDRTAWADLYEAYGPRLRSFALRLTGNQHDADDLVSETFVRALPRLDSLDPGTVELGPYLFTTLRNLFLKTVERGKRVAPVEEVPEPVAPAPIEDDPERSTMLTAQQEGVRAANAKLAPRQRLVLALRELEDRSYAEIGEVVGLNENAVAQLISRARESLRTELRLAEVDPARLPEECRAFLPLLSRHLDGQLKGPQLERTLAHLEGCERCQDALSSMREASRRYRTLILLPGGDEAFAASIDAELTASGYWAGARRGGAARLRRRGAVIATAAALAVAGGAGVGAAVVLSGGPDALVAQTGITPPPTSTEAATSTETTAPPTTTTRRPPRTAPATTAAVTTAPATTPAKPAPATTAPTTATTAPVTTTKPATTAPTTTTTTVAPKPPPPPPPPAIITPPPPPPPPLDRTAPTVTITARPPATTPTGEASFSFRASEAGSTFQCRLDGAAYTPCTSPKAYAGLGAGEHTFAVRARDRAGNLGAAATARWSFVPPDTTPPTVTITSAQISGGDASFSFASESGATFTCSLDGAGPVGCTSPAAYTGLGPGAHSFAVRATDAAGNVSEPATHAWTIAPPPAPDLVISQLTENSFVVTNIGNAPAGAFVVSVTLVGNFTFGGLAPGQSQTRTWSTCRRGTITAIADRGGTVAESNEGNNSRTITSDC